MKTTGLDYIQWLNRGVHTCLRTKVVSNVDRDRSEMSFSPPSFHFLYCIQMVVERMRSSGEVISYLFGVHDNQVFRGGCVIRSVDDFREGFCHNGQLCWER